jgi:hypothetical protein
LNKHRYISRIDSINTHCWYVRVDQKKPSISKTFSDGRFGGKRKSLSAALAYRDAIVSKRKKYLYGWYDHKSDKRSTTGIVGVSVRSYRKITGYRMREYRAVCIDAKTGRNMVRSFSTKKYGEVGAKRLAIAARLRMLNSKLRFMRLNVKDR